MINLLLNSSRTLEDARAMLQTAIDIEFGTLPPYLYALYSIRPGTNFHAKQRIKSVAFQEMIHVSLVCNILNALGGEPTLNPQCYPGPIAGNIGPNGTPLELHLYPFSRQAMKQAMDIEEPEDRPPFLNARAARKTKRAVTVGEFYELLNQCLSKLPESIWISNCNQITDDQFFPGQIFPVNNYTDARRAIHEIVSEGEGSKRGTQTDPLDFQDEVAHYYRFGEIYHDRVLTKASNPSGYEFGPERLGVDWAGIYPAITDPGLYDFSRESCKAQSAQLACNKAFSSMIDALNLAVTGKGFLGEAVKAMFGLRTAALQALEVPLTNPSRVAGPAFLYISSEGEDSK